MTKGAKIGIGIGVIVALGVASYFLFFKNKGKKGKANENDSDDFDGVVFTPFKTKLDGLGRKDTKGSKWVYLESRPKKGKILETDTVVISGTDKFDGEYPITDLWHDKNGNLGAVAISLPDSVYKIVVPKGDTRDRTFQGFGNLTFKRKEGASEIGGCGCGA